MKISLLLAMMALSVVACEDQEPEPAKRPRPDWDRIDTPRHRPIDSLTLNIKSDE